VRHRIDLGDIDDGAGAVARIGAFIPDIDLIGIDRPDLVGIGAANEDAAVGIGLDPEFRPDLVVGILVLGDEEAVPLSATITPSSIRQLASPILLKLSMSLPSNNETHPVSLEACVDQDRAAKPATSKAMAERRFMKILPFDVVFDTGRTEPRGLDRRDDSRR
jgi:hypothetical protein